MRLLPPSAIKYYAISAVAFSFIGGVNVVAGLAYGIAALFEPDGSKFAAASAQVSSAIPTYLFVRHCLNMVRSHGAVVDSITSDR